LVKPTIVSLLNGGRLYLEKSEEQIFRDILLVFYELKKKSLSQKKICDCLFEKKISTKNTIVQAIWKLAMMSYFKINQEARSRVVYLLPKAKKRIKYMTEKQNK
jgi:hypothetical protein